MDIKSAIATLIDGHSLSKAQMKAVMQQVMTGGADEAQIAALLVALRIKGETVDEIVGAAQVMRELALPVAVSGENLVDIVGTGGDGASIFNVSTAASFVAAAAGCKVAKHGNRSVSSKSGAADLLEAAGVRLDLSPEQVARCVDSLGLGFMFAVNHHRAMKYAIGPRRSLGVRTIFNVLGPLTNPAGVKKQLLGVYSRELLQPLAEVMRDLGSEHVLVVHSNDGLDEISIAAETEVAELRDGEIRRYKISPEQFGFKRSALGSLSVESAAESLATISALLKGEPGAAADMVALNAGAAIYAADVASSLAQGVAMAQDVLALGSGAEKMQELVQFSQVV